MADSRRDSNNPSPPLFTRTVAAQLARVSLEFLNRCEAQELLRPRELREGESGYTLADIDRLTLIRRFHESLGLDLEAVEVVLHLRDQILNLMSRMEEMERHFAQKEKELLEEIANLRRRLAVIEE